MNTRKIITHILILAILSSLIHQTKAIEFDPMRKSILLSGNSYQPLIVELTNVRGEFERNDQVSFAITTNGTNLKFYANYNESYVIYENYTLYLEKEENALLFDIDQNGTLDIGLKRYVTASQDSQEDPYKFLVIVYNLENHSIYFDMYIYKSVYSIQKLAPLSIFLTVQLTLFGVVVIKKSRKK